MTGNRHGRTPLRAFPFHATFMAPAFLLATMGESHIEVRTSMQAIFEVRTSILAFHLLLLEKSESDDW